ncbi:DegV family protein [Deinococcus yavapaiensis]|uniref:DegV family protein with EDD domain n=1 Tax=Deinococcus yavapaiensis KR-236 TaxID=694435 RepID=A0A318S9M6_9DEIO|nr:DegV family protein [Deinococcus yavapaiensis]PYE54928.1 DegV family protein with EDD domain [Deinococcus yavapaiensis KR-236]
MIAIVTDSTCDLGLAQLSQLGVTVIPLRVHLGGKQWLDWEELDPDSLYTQMKSGAVATTSPPPVAEFAAVYRRLLAVYDEVVSLHLSSKVSETYAHARDAVETLDLHSRVQVVDSGLATAPLGELVLAAARLAASGARSIEVLAELRTLQESLHVEFTVESLEYLRRGGRLSYARAFLGNLLGVRPVLTFDNGLIVPTRTVRGRDVMDDMVARLEERFASQPIGLVIAYAGRDRERIDALRRSLEGSKLVIRHGRIQLIGAVVGAYAGPGAYGVAAYPVP